MVEYFSENLWQLWAIVAVLGLLLELTSGDFFIMCFAIGAVGAAIVSPFTSFLVQLAVFAAVTALSIFQVRPFALRYLHRNDEIRASNAEALVGQLGVVSQTIPAGGGFGRVAIGGDDWKAVASTDDTVLKGARVKVVSLDSIILTVEPVG